MVKMNNYFLLSAKTPSKQVASAFAPKGVKLNHELIKELEGIHDLPFEFNLFKLTLTENGLVEDTNLYGLKNIWRDYQPNSLAWPLFSKKMKNIIDDSLTGQENIDWISARVNGNNEQKIYYIPRFNKSLNVLDMENTMFVEGTDHVIIPAFSISKIINYNLFHIPSSSILSKITHRIYVNETLKMKLLEEKLIGIDFSTAKVV